MASVAVEDIYKDIIKDKTQRHYLKIGRLYVILFAILLSFMATISYYWQQYTALPLLNFALGVMAFAYASLLGVYFAGIIYQLGGFRKKSFIWL